MPGRSTVSPAAAPLPVHRLGAPAETPEEQRRLWDEGSFEDRAAVLRRVRAADPARGREWLAPVLPQEKADLSDLDHARADRVLPVLAHILGVTI